MWAMCKLYRFQQTRMLELQLSVRNHHDCWQDRGDGSSNIFARIRNIFLRSICMLNNSSEGTMMGVEPAVKAETRRAVTF